MQEDKSAEVASDTTWLQRNYDALIPIAVAAVVFGLAVTRYPIPSVIHDAYAYTMSAMRLISDGVYAYASGEMPGTAVVPDARVTPGYILFLSAFYALLSRGGDALAAVQSVHPWVVTAQFLLALAGVGLLALCGRELGGRRLGLITGLMGSAYLPFAWSTSVALSESIIFPLVALQLWLTLKVTAKRSTMRTWKALLGYGILSAVVVMVRPSTALWVLVPLAYAWIARVDSWNTLLKLTGVAVLGFLLVFTPWWARNYRAIGRFVPLRTDTVRTAPGRYESIATEAPSVLSSGERLKRALQVTRAPYSAPDDVAWENTFHYDEGRVDFGSFTASVHTTLVPAIRLMRYYQIVLLALAVASLAFVRRSPRLLILATVPVYTIAVHYTTQLSPRYAYLMWPAVIVMAAAGAYGLYAVARKSLAHR